MQLVTEQQPLSLISLIFCFSLKYRTSFIAELCFWGGKIRLLLQPKSQFFPDRKREHKQRIGDAISCYFELEIIRSWLQLCHTDLSLASRGCKAVCHHITALQIPDMRVIHRLF